MNDESLHVVKCDLKKEAHREAVINLLNEYMKDPMGGGKSMPEDIKERLTDELAAHPAHFILFACAGDQYIGIAACFIGFSTFQAKKLVNVHDLAVLPAFRNRGVGRLLLRGIEDEARRLDCCKITLEVRKDNLHAQALYQNEGFLDGEPPMFFWTKPL